MSVTTNAAATNVWFSNLRPRPDARVRLFCVPYGGGTATVFHQWPDGLPADVEVWAVNLPGRGRRLMEPAFTSLAPLVDLLSQAILPLLDRPFAFFGHSMGALIEFEAARQLRKSGARLPDRLFVGGCFAPHLPDPHPIHHLPEAEFINEVRRLGGMPAEVLANQELLELVLPSLRADFTVTETYTATEEPPLPSAISVFGGWRDPITDKQSLEAWRSHTSGEFSVRMLPGDHFFLISQQRLLLNMISDELRQS
ncbi:MAG TPA: alpha/beta fold hydrolase [Verrucomicrobiae bacterium]|nr:alpha/beta fold hydrolase [Verrucomicrobiae bacterium]